MKTFRASLLASVALCCVGSNAFVRADVVLNPVSASDTSHYSDWTGTNVSASKTIDGSGLSDASLVDNGDPVPASWPTNDASATSLPGFPLNYVSNLGEWSIATVTYTFAKAVNITGGHFWQYGGDGVERSLYSADIYVSSNGIDYTAAGTLLPGYQESSTATLDPGVNFSLTANGVRYVRLQNLHPYAEDTTNNAQQMVGFGEIRFVGTVPEPSTIVMAFVGLVGLLAYAWRKRK